MKRLELSLIFISSIHLCSAQEISFAHNMYRGGDVLIKKMVSPVDPGSTGNKKVWSLEDVTIEQKKYKQAFKDNPDDIHSIKSTESGNRNYYQLRHDTLYSQAFENNQTKITFDHPEIELLFPFSFGDSIQGVYHGTGTYCDKLRLRVYGQYSMKADAYGTLVTPEGDSIRNVLRVHKKRKGIMELFPRDTILSSFSEFGTDSIVEKVYSEDKIIVEDEYRWYVTGYRYPVLEENIITMYGQHITSALYTPLSQQETLPLDDDNLQIRNAGHFHDETDERMGQGNVPIRYDYDVNTASHTVHFSYDLSRPAEVTFILSDQQGIVYRKLSKKQPAGSGFTADIDYGGLRKGLYVIYIKVDEEQFVEKFNNR